MIALFVHVFIEVFYDISDILNCVDNVLGDSEKTWGVWQTVTPHLVIRLS